VTPPAASSFGDPDQVRARLLEAKERFDTLAVRRGLMGVNHEAPGAAAGEDPGPLLQSVCQLARAWTSPIADDSDGALREASGSPEQLRGQDEPFFTALAAYTAALGETALGRRDGALPHTRETRDLADRFDYARLTATSRVRLGTLAVVQGGPDQARELLDEALDMSLTIRNTRNVTMCLAALARLAFAEGDPERRRRPSPSLHPIRRIFRPPGRLFTACSRASA
jgi:hypothetical protein